MKTVEWRPLGLLTLLAASACTPRPMTREAPAPVAAIDSIMAAYREPGKPGAAVLVTRHGRTLVTRPYGLAEVETGRRVVAETNFRLASLTKQFTATAIMLLAHDGRLSYDDPVGRWVDGLPTWARNVTIRQLMTHTGGLPDYEDFVPDSQTRQVLDAEIPALIANASGPLFPPGTKYSYSNTGFVLLASVVERASGKSFPDFLRERIFAPLGMSHTLAFVNGGPAIPERAYGYRVAPGGITRTDQSNTSATLGDGGVYSNVVDLAKWHRALEEHTLVSAADQQLAWTRATLNDGTRGPYGFGWFVDDTGRGVELWHHGQSRGFTNFVLKDLSSGVTVVILSNRTSKVPEGEARAILGLFTMSDRP